MRTVQRLPPLHRLQLQLHQHRHRLTEEALNEVLAVLAEALLLVEENTTPGVAPRPPVLVRVLEMRSSSKAKRRNSTVVKVVVEDVAAVAVVVVIAVTVVDVATLIATVPQAKLTLTRKSTSPGAAMTVKPNSKPR